MSLNLCVNTLVDFCAVFAKRFDVVTTRIYQCLFLKNMTFPGHTFQQLFEGNQSNFKITVLFKFLVRNT